MDAPPPGLEPRDVPVAQPLRAGPLSLLFEAGGLRHVTWGGREVVRRIYAAVRDPDWNTVPGVVSGLEIEGSGEAFRIGFTCTHQLGAVHFVWRAAIRGEPDGTIRFVFDGEARSTFRRNRIGFCVLHPIRECAGAVCRARYANGTEAALRFPDTIAAEQPVRGLHDLAGLDHEIEPGVWAALDFAGDLFEMEDQRNWIDASFKTYCTPLRLPFPMEIRAGTRVRQEVRLRIVRGPRAAGKGGPGVAGGPVVEPPDHGLSPGGTRDEESVVVRLVSGVVRLPALGLGLPDAATPLAPDQAQRLRALNLAHLRVDLRLWESDWPGRLEQAAGVAGLLGAKLEVALHLDETPWNALASAVDALANRRGSVARVLVLHRHQKSTTPAALGAARAVLTVALPGTPLGAGTDADLYQLNLQRPPAEADFIGWSMNPQVHAFDDLSLVETPEAAGHQVLSVRRYFPGRPLVVSPVTLRPRFNPNATGPVPDVPPGELPPQVDPRQLSLLGAAWTLAMVKALAESGADSVTFYETVGWRGVMESAAGSPLPDRFPSIAGAVYPLYHVLADVGEFAGGEVRRTMTSRPLAVASLLLSRGDRRRLVLANLGPVSRRIAFEGLAGFRLRRCLDAGSGCRAMTRPELFRSTPGADAALPEPFELGPGAIATLDFPVP